MESLRLVQLWSLEPSRSGFGRISDEIGRNLVEDVHQTEVTQDGMVMIVYKKVRLQRLDKRWSWAIVSWTTYRSDITMNNVVRMKVSKASRAFCYLVDGFHINGHLRRQKG